MNIEIYIGGPIRGLYNARVRATLGQGLRGLYGEYGENGEDGERGGRGGGERGLGWTGTRTYTDLHGLTRTNTDRDGFA